MEHHCRTKATAEKFAMAKRQKGFRANVYKTKKGYSVSVTRK